LGQALYRTFLDLVDQPGEHGALLEESVNATKALDEQIKRYRRMSGEQRLAVALELHELSCDIAREGIRHQHPQADAAEVERGNANLRSSPLIRSAKISVDQRSALWICGIRTLLLTLFLRWSVVYQWAGAHPALLT
jgi:Rv0078B-related antitoxin